MINKFSFSSNFGFNRDRKLFLPTHSFDLQGIWHFELWREKKSGNKKKVEDFDFHNGITNVGKNYILNVGFDSGSQILTGAWCAGLIDNSGTPTLASADTMGSHAWTEFTSYTQSNRVAWGPSTSTAQLLTNGTLMTFDISSNGTLYGAFITSDNTKSGTSGTLWSTGAFPSTVPVSGGTDSIRLTYALSC